MACRVCLKDGDDCRACVRQLFGADEVPKIDVTLARLHTLALSVAGKISLSGVQRKISVGFDKGRQTLQVQLEDARYILKPQAVTFPQLPENEHLTMRLAHLFGLEIPPCGLFPLEDGTPAYVVRRFDRGDDGRKIRAEDFCQLSEQPPKEKYESSAERVAKRCRRFTSEPGVEVLKLFRILVFSWWVGNGDLHLKNLALITDHDGLTRLSPCYDLLSTRLVIPGDSLALTIQGKRDNLTRRSWLGLAANAGIPVRAAERVLGEPGRRLEQALGLVAGSSLASELKGAYSELLTARAATG
jgi:serine/threonine-protein kinase HipA